MRSRFWSLYPFSALVLHRRCSILHSTTRILRIGYLFCYACHGSGVGGYWFHCTCVPILPVVTGVHWLLPDLLHAGLGPRFTRVLQLLNSYTGPPHLQDFPWGSSCCLQVPHSAVLPQCTVRPGSHCLGHNLGPRWITWRCRAHVLGLPAPAQITHHCHLRHCLGSPVVPSAPTPAGGFLHHAGAGGFLYPLPASRSDEFQFSPWVTHCHRTLTLSFWNDFLGSTAIYLSPLVQFCTAMDSPCAWDGPLWTWDLSETLSSALHTCRTAHTICITSLGFCVLYRYWVTHAHWILVRSDARDSSFSDRFTAPPRTSPAWRMGCASCPLPLPDDPTPCSGSLQLPHVHRTLPLCTSGVHHHTTTLTPCVTCDWIHRHRWITSLPGD